MMMMMMLNKNMVGQGMTEEVTDTISAPRSTDSKLPTSSSRPSQEHHQIEEAAFPLRKWESFLFANKSTQKKKRKIINTGKEANNQEGLDLMATAASWLAESETLTNDKGKDPMLLPYRIKDHEEANVKSLPTKFEALLNVATEETNVKAGEDNNGNVVQKQKKHLTKPRSTNMERKPRISYTSLIITPRPKATSADSKLSKNKEEEYLDPYRRMKGRKCRLFEAAKGGFQCTRRNGKGWRCKEIARVGYQLCDKHVTAGHRLKG